MKVHKNTFLPLEELGTQFPSYQPTFDFQGEFIDSAHRFFGECSVNDDSQVQMRNPFWFRTMIKGFLRRADALKLYELAYFVQGDILELGSYQGLSTCILSSASQNSSGRKRIISVDLSLLRVSQTRFNLHTMKLHRGVTVRWAEAASAMRRLARDHREFEFVFIDHSHAYAPVYAVCRELRGIVKKDGFCLFHDFNDSRNTDAHDDTYGVYQAVTEGLSPDEFEFCGIYGCSALYRAI